MRHLLGKVLRVSRWLGIALAAVVPLTWWMAQTEAASRWFLARAVSYAEKLGVEVRVGAFTYDLWEQSFEIRQLRLQAKGASAPFLQAQRIFGHYFYSAEKDWNLQLVRDVEVDGLHVDLRRDARGDWNLPTLASGSGRDPGFPLKTLLRRMRITYSDTAGNRLVLPDVTVKGRAQGWEARLGSPGELNGGKVERLMAIGSWPWDDLGASFQVDVRHLPVSTGRWQAPPVDVSVGFSFYRDHLRVGGFSVRSALGTLTGGGIVALRAGQASSMKFQAEGQGLKTEGYVYWRDRRWEAFNGIARVTSKRRDVWGGGAALFNRHELRLQMLLLEHRWGEAEGRVAVAFPSLALSGDWTGTFRAVPGIEGAGAFRAQLGGSMQEPRVQAAVTSSSLGAGALHNVHLSGQVSYRHPLVSIPQATLGWNGQQAQVVGEVRLTERNEAALNLAVTVPEVDLARLLQNPRVSGSGAARATVKGTLATPLTEGTMEGRGLSVYGEEFGAWRGVFTGQGSRWEWGSGEVEKGAGRIESRGWVDLGARTYQVRAETHGWRLEESVRGRRGLPELRGELKATLVGEGSLDDPRATLEAQVAEMVRVSARLDREGMDYEATAPEVVKLEPRPGLTVEGRPEARGRLRWAAPEESPATVTVAGLVARSAGHEVRAGGTIRVAVDGARLRLVEPVTLESEGAQLTVEGSLPWREAEGAQTLAVRGEVPLSLTERHWPGLQWKGRASVKGGVAGTVEKPEARLSVQVADGELSAPEVLRAGPIRAIATQVEVAGERVTMDKFSATLPSGTVQGAGWLTYDGTRPPAFEWSGSFAEVNPAALMLSEQSARWRAVLSGQVRLWSSAFESLGDLNGETRLTELRWQTPSASAAQTAPSELRLEQGRISIGRLQLDSSQGKFEATGSAELTGQQELALRLKGQLEASLFVPAAQDGSTVAGPVDVSLEVGGTLNAPQMTGQAHWREGRLALTSPVAMAGDGIEVVAAFDGRTVRIESATGSVNGSPVKGSGSLTLGGRSIAAVDLQLAGRGLFVEYPKGFQSASDFDLRLQGGATGPVSVGGRVLVLDGAYREGMNLASLAASLLASRQSAGEGGWLNRLRYNVRIDTQQPLIVDNNLGRLTADAELRLVGPVANPSLTGRLEIEEGSRVYFAGRTFQVNQGIVDFTDETRLTPRFNLEAESTVSSYRVTLKLSGDTGRTETTLTSEPALSDDQVRMLLFTGNPEATGSYGALAQTQALSLFGSGMAGGLATLLRNKLGLSEFRIDPSLISADKDPTARLTIGQNLTPELRLAYSTNLTNAQDQIWTAEYDWRRRFLGRFFRETNQSNRFELRYKLRFGGGDKTGDSTTRAPRQRFRIRRIEFVGTTGFDQETLAKELKLKPGQSYDFLQSQKALGRLRTFYGKKGYWQARIFQERSNRGEADGGVDLTYHIEASRPVHFIYEGASLPERVKRRVGQLWLEGIVDAQRLGSVSREIQGHLVGQGFARAKVEAAIRETEAGRTVVFDIEQGVNDGRPRISFPGVPAALALDLQFLLLRTRLDRQTRANPTAVMKAVSEHLRELGYLAAEVREPQRAERRTMGGVAIAIPVELGPVFTLGTLTFEGATSLPVERLRAAAGLAPGDRYLNEARFAMAQSLERAYWNEGYREARVTAEEVLDRPKGRANLTVRVVEGRRVMTGSIRVEGESATSEGFVRKRLAIAPGDPLSAERVSRSRKNLLDSTAYNRIDITYEPGPTSTPGGDEVRNVVVTVREPKPYRADVGGTYDTERGVGTLLDVSATNLFREARTLGFRTTLDKQKQDYRLYFTQPFWGRERLLTTATAFRTFEDRGLFDTDITGVSLQQSWRFKPRWNLTYGYQLELATVKADLRDLRISISERVSTAISTLTYDSRDAVLDATRGMFFSTAAEYGPRQLGGTLGYYKGYWQASRYFGLTKPQAIPFENVGTRRSRVVYAANVRVGLSNTLGANDLLPTDRFYAGGGTSVRGYGQNTVGPVLEDGSPAGGRATFVLNNEVRLPIWGPVEGVPFIDVGNVWAKPSEFALSDLRTGAGLGLRLRTPIVLLRFDYGWKVGRRPGETAGAFFFSIGQTF